MRNGCQQPPQPQIGRQVGTNADTVQDIREGTRVLVGGRSSNEYLNALGVSDQETGGAKNNKKKGNNSNNNRKNNNNGKNNNNDLNSAHAEEYNN